MVSLTLRPLTASDHDAALFVDREEELLEAERALARRVNVLVVGPRRSGRTSLVRRLAARLRENRRVAIIDAAHPPNLAALLEAIADAAHVAAPDLRSDDAVTELSVRAVLAGEEPVLFILDNVSPETARDLFGRFRDTLWDFDHQWVVVAEEDHRRSEYLAPPADAIFGALLELAPLAPQDVQALLLRRIGSAAGRDAERLRAVAATLGAPDQPPRQPGQAIALAQRAVLASGPVAEVLDRRTPLRERAAAQGPAAAELFEILEALGPVHAGDERLLEATGTSRSRATQLLKVLERARVVVARREGRRVLYDIADAPPA